MKRSRNSSQALAGTLQANTPCSVHPHSLSPRQANPSPSLSTKPKCPFPSGWQDRRASPSTARRQCGLTRSQILAVVSKACHQVRQEHAIRQQCEVLGHAGQPSLRRAEGALSSGGTRFQRTQSLLKEL